VLLPFFLGLIIAYVLTPLVARCERARIPRPAAILLVYAVTISILYFSIAAIAPRIYDEGAKFARDAPALVDEAAKNWDRASKTGCRASSTDAPSLRRCRLRMSRRARRVHQRADGVLENRRRQRGRRRSARGRDIGGWGRPD